MLRLIPGQHVHIVGIGGFGMSAIARILLAQGFYVSGSDRSSNALTQALEREGAVIYKGHDAEQVMGAELVIATSAAPADHVELGMARALGIPVYKRAEVMAALMVGQTAVCVAGTHGKTTTSAMIAHILLQTGQQPSYMIGGILRNTGRNAALGRGRAFVVEADEYDNMFLGLRPDVAVVTSVEYDHPDFFNSPNAMVQTFSQFINLLPENGLLVACADDTAAAILGQNRLAAGLPVVVYGVHNSQAQRQARHISVDAEGYTTFEVWHEGALLGAARLAIPGRHNILNALAALIVAEDQGVPFGDAVRALATFQGTGRRFEVRGEIGGVTLIDDYAHHPTAIRATLNAARDRFPRHTLWAVWQPHTYSRTEHLWDDYLNAFAAADHVLVTDVFAAREQPVADVNSARFVAALDHADARHAPGLVDAARVLHADVQAPAVIVIMSAGDAPLIGVEFLKLRQSDPNDRTADTPQP